LAAIKEAELWEEFQTHARYDGESLLVTDKNLTTWLRRGPGKPDQQRKVHEAPEIDRNDLRRVLVDSVPKEIIQWGMKLARVQETGAGLELHFAGGEIRHGFDLIVGSDGAFSKTRKLLTSEQPFYSGLSGYTMQIPNAQVTAPDIYNFVNRGSVLAYSDGKSMTIQQLTSGDIWISTYSQGSEDNDRTGDTHSADLVDAKQALDMQFQDWAPKLRNVFKPAAGSVARRQIYMLPVGFTWEHKKGVTLLGDAAHLMSPFSGIGVNTAFYDALLLSRQIVKFASSGEQRDLDTFIADYEKEMFQHAHKAQEHSTGSMNDMLFTPGAPRTSIESWILRHTKEEMPTWLRPVLIAVVHVGYWIYKLFV
jgi:2-polyprenyl-6-methoxyphenol hydroxylase-like FAD-dependent oxidoreductase